MYKMLTEDQQTGVGYYDYGRGGKQKIQESNFLQQKADSRATTYFWFGSKVTGYYHIAKLNSILEVSTGQN